MRHLLILIVVALLIPLASHAATPEEVQIEQLRARLQQLQEERVRIEADLTTTQAQKQTLQREISSLQGQIRLVQNQISSTAAQINITRGEIGQVQDTIASTRAQMSRKRETIGRTILFLEQRDREDLVASLFKYAGFSEFFRQLDDTEAVQQRLLGVIFELKEDKESLEQQQVTLEEKQSTLEELNDEAAQRKAELDAVTYQKSKVLKDTKGQESEYQKMLAENERLEREANLEIFKLEEKLRLALDPNSLPLARPGVLAWPMAATGIKTQPYGCIETAFARRNYPDCNGTKGGFHNGYDIAAPYGTKLFAAEDGKVVAVGSAPRAYGVWLVVEHTSGLLTAYTHMSSRDVSVGQVVKRGDVVGRMGSTGLSTGSHLHFMVYAPKTFSVQNSAISGTLPIGATLNPAEYL